MRGAHFRVLMAESNIGISSEMLKEPFSLGFQLIAKCLKPRTLSPSRVFLWLSGGQSQGLPLLAGKKQRSFQLILTCKYIVFLISLWCRLRGIEF